LSWPESLDALSAAPAHHRKLFENESVRVLEARIGAGETTAVHTHRWPSVQHVLATTDFVRRDADGAVLLDTRTDGGRPELGDTLWSGPFPPHSLENVGPDDLLVLMVEIKDAAPAVS
jgi:hypothetical protein